MGKPNIILIYIDDMGWRDLNCYGSAFYETPNIDRLAAEGARFTQAYATCPVCSPSRASVMTGKYPATVGLTDWLNWTIGDNERDAAHRGRLMDVPYVRHLPKGEKTIASALSENGYAAWHIGKWHLGCAGSYPRDFGFDVNIGGSEFGCPMSGYFSPYNLPNLEDGEEGEFLTDSLTDEAIRLIRNHKSAGSGKPFFLNMWHYAVHTPVMGKSGDVKRFKDKAKRHKLDQIDPIVAGEHFRFEEAKHMRIQRRVLQSDPAYAALVYNLDWNVGRLLEAVDVAGISNDTLVAFTSDNGGLSTCETSPTCNLPLAEGKGWLYDGGVRVPFIARFPGVIPPGSVSDEIVTGADLYPTFLEAAGLAPMPRQHRDGLNIIPVLRGEGNLNRDAVFWHYPHYCGEGSVPGCAVRSGDYKLIEFFEDGRLELYDLSEDLSETRDLAAARPEVRDRLYGLLNGWKESVEASIPEANPGYVPGGEDG